MTEIHAARIKHLEFLQATIARMAQHSFAIRTLAVTVTAAAVTYAVNAKSPHALVGAVAAAVVFWALDGFYLHLERAYRSLFDVVRAGDGASDFSMSTKAARGARDYLKAVFSTTNLLLYPALLGLSVAAMMYTPPPTGA